MWRGGPPRAPAAEAADARRPTLVERITKFVKVAITGGGFERVEAGENPLPPVQSLPTPEVMSLQQQIAERDAKLAAAYAALAESHATSAKKDEIIAEKDEKLAEKDEKLAEKDEKLAEKDEKLAEKDEKLAEQVETIAEQAKTIANIRAQLAKRDEDAEKKYAEENKPAFSGESQRTVGEILADRSTIFKLLPPVFGVDSGVQTTSNSSTRISSTWAKLPKDKLREVTDTEFYAECLLLGESLKFAPGSVLAGQKVYEYLLKRKPTIFTEHALTVNHAEHPTFVENAFTERAMVTVFYPLRGVCGTELTLPGQQQAPMSNADLVQSLAYDPHHGPSRLVNVTVKSALATDVSVDLQLLEGPTSKFVQSNAAGAPFGCVDSEQDKAEGKMSPKIKKLRSFCSSISVEMKQDRLCPRSWKSTDDDNIDKFNIYETSLYKYSTYPSCEVESGKVNPLVQITSYILVSLNPYGIVSTYNRWAFVYVSPIKGKNGRVSFRVNVTRFYRIDEFVTFGGKTLSVPEMILLFSLAAAKFGRLAPSTEMQQLFEAKARPKPTEDDKEEEEEDETHKGQQAGGKKDPSTKTTTTTTTTAPKTTKQRGGGVVERELERLYDTEEFRAFEAENPSKAWRQKAGMWLFLCGSPAAREQEEEDELEELSSFFPFSYSDINPSLANPDTKEEDACIICSSSRTGSVLRRNLNGVDCALKMLSRTSARDGDEQPSLATLEAEMTNEARVYERLADLQVRKDVPTSYGLWDASLGFAWFLVLSYEGVGFKDGEKNLSVSDGIAMSEILARVHDCGVLHRDLALRNFVKNHEGKILLLDFGLAKIRRRDARDDEEDEEAAWWEEETRKEKAELQEILLKAGWLPPVIEATRGKRNAVRVILPNSAATINSLG